MKRPPPGTAPKPGATRGGYGDDFPAPPPDLMNQAYQQQQHRTPGIYEECPVASCHAFGCVSVRHVSVTVSVILD